MIKKRFLTSYLFILSVSLFAGFLFKEIYLTKNPVYAEGIFTIEEGEKLSDIAKNLKNDGFIQNEDIFNFYIFALQEDKNIKAGTYNLSSAMTMNEIADKLINENTIKEKITTLEGWDIYDIAEYFEEKGITTKENFLALTESPVFLNKYSYLNDISLEGFLFPDTYYFNYNDNPEDVVGRMLENFDTKLTDSLKEEILSQGKTIQEIIIMASLIEKEVPSWEDKRAVAGVLWKRLENDFPLQVDSSILYGKNDGIVDTKYDSPYNTYLYNGLPIGPICNPGIESIMAAIYPEENEYWYYLSAKTGETIFSKTFEEHKYNKWKYLY